MTNDEMKKDELLPGSVYFWNRTRRVGPGGLLGCNCNPQNLIGFVNRAEEFLIDSEGELDLTVEHFSNTVITSTSGLRKIAL